MVLYLKNDLTGMTVLRALCVLSYVGESVISSRLF